MWQSILQAHLHWSSATTMASWMDLDEVSEDDDSWADTAVTEPQTKHARKGGKGKGGNKKKSQSQDPPRTHKDGKINMKESTLERKAHVLNLKMNLNSQQQLREVSHVCRVCLQCPSDSQMIQECLVTNLKYHKTVTRPGRGHGKGDPHLYLWPTMMSHCLTASQGGDKTLLQAHSNLIMDKNIGKEEIAKAVAICRIKKTKKEDGKPAVHLIFLQPFSASNALMAAVLDTLVDHLGCSRKWSKAPPSALEREGQNLLKQFKA